MLITWLFKFLCAQGDGNLQTERTNKGLDNVNIFQRKPTINLKKQKNLFLSFILLYYLLYLSFIKYLLYSLLMFQISFGTPSNFYFLSSRVIQLTPYFMILLVLIFIVNRNFKLLNRHSILLLFFFVLLPFCFLYSFYIIIVWVIAVIAIYLLLLLFTHLFTYLFIHIYCIIYLFVLWS